MTKNTLEEECPALGSPGQGLTTEAPKTWRSKRVSNVPEVWESTTLKGPWIKATADQIENDRLFAKSLPNSEYTQLSEYDENDEDNYNPAEQEEVTNKKNEILFDGHHQIERL